MGKLIKILGILALILVLLVIGAGILIYSWMDGLRSTAAHLIIDKGEVEMKIGELWKKTSDTDLVKGDIVKTLEESEATIIFFETSFIKLFPGTEVEIKELSREEAKVVLKQNSGKTWHEVIQRAEEGETLETITGLLGINDYQVEVPNAIASVRGTSFGLDLNEEESRLAVLEGTVKFKAEGTEENVQEKEEAKISRKELKKAIKKKILEEDNFVKWGKLAKEKNKELIKKRLKKKYARLFKVAQERFNLTESQIDQGIDDYLAGKLKLPRIGLKDLGNWKAEAKDTLKEMNGVEKNREERLLEVKEEAKEQLAGAEEKKEQLREKKEELKNDWEARKEEMQDEIEDKIEESQAKLQEKAGEVQAKIIGEEKTALLNNS